MAKVQNFSRLSMKAHLNFQEAEQLAFGSEGTIENSPAVHCRVGTETGSSPERDD
jgi:hypothetical protein